MRFSGCAILMAIIFSTISIPQLSAQKIPTSQAEMAAAIKEVLLLGVDVQVIKLSKHDGFFKNPSVKIILPKAIAEAEIASSTKHVSLLNHGVELLNRAAENAVVGGLPIFRETIGEMNFKNARMVLLSTDDAATTHFKKNQSEILFGKFRPLVYESIKNVGADKVWQQIILEIPVAIDQNVITDVTDYVTNEALDGVFKMVALEEKKIRTSPILRTTPLIKQVFAIQD